MKFFISLLMLVSLNIKANVPYFLIHSLNEHASSVVSQILISRYGIDARFIKTIQMACHHSDQFMAIHFCINKKGELKTLSLNKKILNKSKEIFKRLR